MVRSPVQADEEEACRALERLRLKREKDEVRLESMLIARDLRTRGCWRVREIGLRGQRALVVHSLSSSSDLSHVLSPLTFLSKAGVGILDGREPEEWDEVG
jgi:hypothetical protein